MACGERVYVDEGVWGRGRVGRGCAWMRVCGDEGVWGEGVWMRVCGDEGVWG